MQALALSYFASTEFRTLRASTQRAYRGTIERLCKEHGYKRAADLRREHVVRLMAALAEQPGAANALRMALRMALRVTMKHAIEIGLRDDDPTREVRAIRTRTGGHHSWTDDEIAQFERYHPIGSRARLALALLLYTGQRRGDVIRTGAQHIRNGALHIKQEKTGVELIIPVHPALAAIIAAAPRHHLTFVTTRLGGRFRVPHLAAGFETNAIRRGCAPPTVLGRLRLAVWPRLVAPHMRSERLRATRALRNLSGIPVPPTSGDLPRRP
jgi:integrase